MFGYIYKTTDHTNGKIYIGKKHVGVFLENSYLGSGIKLKAAIKAHGKENFTAELIEYADDLETLNEKEKYYIKFWDCLNPEIGYNISDGGDGIPGIVAWNRGLTAEEDSRLKKSDETKHKHSEALKAAYREGKRLPNTIGYTKGLKRTAEQIKANSERQLGKRWMYLEVDNKVVDVTTPFRDEIDLYLLLGYKFGRGNYEKEAWNKGKTAETDESMKKVSETRKKLFEGGKSVGCYGLLGAENKNSTYALAKEFATLEFYNYWYENGKCNTMKHFNIGPATFKHCCEILNIIETSEHKFYIRSKSRKSK